MDLCLIQFLISVSIALVLEQNFASTTFTCEDEVYFKEKEKEWWELVMSPTPNDIFLIRLLRKERMAERASALS